MKDTRKVDTLQQVSVRPKAQYIVFIIYLQYNILNYRRQYAKIWWHTVRSNDSFWINNGGDHKWRRKQKGVLLRQH